MIRKCVAPYLSMEGWNKIGDVVKTTKSEDADLLAAFRIEPVDAGEKNPVVPVPIITVGE